MTDSRLAASWVSRRQLCHTRSAAAATAGGSQRIDLSPERVMAGQKLNGNERSNNKKTAYSFSRHFLYYPEIVTQYHKNRVMSGRGRL